MDEQQLICFPPVAASSMIYMKWQPLVGESIKIIPIEFSGRGIRFREEPMKTFDERKEDLIVQLKKKVNFEKTYSLLGFCFSDIFVYDIYKTFLSQGIPLPKRIFLTSAGIPAVQAERPPLQNVASETLKFVFRNLFKFRDSEDESVRDVLFNDMLTVYDANVDKETKNKADQNLMAALLESEESAGNLHAYQSFKNMVGAMFEDSRIVHTYEEEKPITKFMCPVTMFAGKYDTIVPLSDAKDWEQYCGNEFELIELEGGHTAIVDNSKFTTKLIKERLMK